MNKIPAERMNQKLCSVLPKRLIRLTPVILSESLIASPQRDYELALHLDAMLKSRPQRYSQSMTKLKNKF